jgi:3-deoxy-7-phosphoheptulonate synthase
MLVVMRNRATMGAVREVVKKAQMIGLRAHVVWNTERTVVGVVGEEKLLRASDFDNLSEVERVTPLKQPYKLASREFIPSCTRIELANGATIGGDAWVVMAGPCAVESESQIMDSAAAISAVGAHVLRGGAFKPRSSPYSFQGHGERGLEWLARAGQRHSLAVITEVMAIEQISTVCHYADILQVGARNMQNFPLLTALGKTNKPVLLKRGLSATIEEWLMSAEYILAQGNFQVILCERGIRTFERYTRNTLDINAIPLLKTLTHLPVMADPSHGTGRSDLVLPVSRASLAAGADGLIIETHPDPDQALSDGPQSLRHDQFSALMDDIRMLSGAMSRTLPRAAVPTHTA